MARMPLWWPERVFTQRKLEGRKSGDAGIRPPATTGSWGTGSSSSDDIGRAMRFSGSMPGGSCTFSNWVWSRPCHLSPRPPRSSVRKASPSLKYLEKVGCSRVK